MDKFVANKIILNADRKCLINKPKHLILTYSITDDVIRDKTHPSDITLNNYINIIINSYFS
jgi:hypothetical protein